MSVADLIATLEDTAAVEGPGTLSHILLVAAERLRELSSEGKDGRE